MTRTPTDTVIRNGTDAWQLAMCEMEADCDDGEDADDREQVDSYVAQLVASQARAPNESTPATLDDDECWPAARYQELVERVHALAAEPEVEELGV